MCKTNSENASCVSRKPNGTYKGSLFHKYIAMACQHSCLLAFEWCGPRKISLALHWYIVVGSSSLGMCCLFQLPVSVVLLFILALSLSPSVLARGDSPFLLHIDLCDATWVLPFPSQTSWVEQPEVAAGASGVGGWNLWSTDIINLLTPPLVKTRAKGGH